MRDVINISSVIAESFPEIYANTALLRFIEGYYDFLHQDPHLNGLYNTLEKSFDADLSVEGYVDVLKSQWIPSIPSTTALNGRRVISASSELLAERGTPQSVVDFMRIIYDESADIVYPSTRILRASDSEWVVPEYIETEFTERLPDMLGRQIEGSVSGATGFVEQILLKTINGASVSVLYVVDTIGSFVYGDIITENGDVTGAPRVIGSLSSITITNGGRGFRQGDIFDVETERGILGRVKVDTVLNATGRMTPIVIDGGSGYSQIDTSSETLVSEALAFVDDISNVDNNITTFELDETLVIPYESVDLLSSTLTLTNGDIIRGTDGSTVVAQGRVARVVGDRITINTTVGSFDDAVIVYGDDLETSNALIDLYEDVTFEARLIGQNTTAIGMHSNTTPIYEIDNLVIRGLTSNTTAVVGRVATGQSGSFDIGLLENTEFVSLYTDIIGQYNTSNVIYNQIKISGEGSGVGFLDSVTVSQGGSGYVPTDTITVVGGDPIVNATVDIVVVDGVITDVVGNNLGEGYLNTPELIINTATGTGAVLAPNMNFGYGFPKKDTGGPNNILDTILGFDRFTIGSISTLSRINTGTMYNANPFIYARNPFIAGYNRRNLIATIDNVSGRFFDGEGLSQDIVEDGFRLTINTLSSPIAVGDSIVQVSSGASGQVNASNTTHIEIEDIEGTYDGSLVFESPSSGSNITASVREQISLIRSPKGSVISQDGDTLYIKRESFNTSFSSSFRLEGIDSGASADIINVVQDVNGPVMGNNAVITANVIVADGVVGTASILSSGFGYVDGDEVVLTNDDSEFISTGVIGIGTHGRGEGYWKTTNSHLIPENRLQDNDYWQTHSYVVKTGLALDKYSDVLKRLVHVAGTKLFGEFVFTDDTDEKTKIEEFSIEVT